MRGRDLILKAGGVKMSLTAQVQALFAGGKVGGMWDLGDTSTLFQEAVGATPVTAVTQPIGRVNDKSGNGNHATQSTAGARPLFSARKNLLQKTENFADGVWATASSSLGAATVFSSGNIANLVVDIATNDQHTRITNASVGAGPVTVSFRVRKKDLDYVVFRAVQDGIICWFNVSLGSPGTVTGAATTSISEAGDDFVCVVKFVTAGSLQMHFGVSTADATLSYMGSGIGNYIGEPQLEIGATATRYQRVNTDSDYDTVGFPAFAQFDGVDDALATGAITLDSNMDCFIAVRRESAAWMIFCYAISNGNGFFGCFTPGDSNPAVDTAGTPTLFVNGVPVPGGAATTRGQLDAAIPVGPWVLFEARNLDLSTWTAFKVGGYLVGYSLNGSIGGIVLISALSTEDRNLVRTYLGSKVGLTL